VTSNLPSTGSLGDHIRGAVAGAAVVTDPGPHMVISDLLPVETYTRLLETMPPPEAFEVADKVKANFDPVRTENAPEGSRDAWLHFHTEIVDRLLTPLLLEAFRPSLLTAYRALFGPGADEAIGLRHRAFRGRLMLRRPGYHLNPHRDMKIAAFTGLVYFARAGDSREYGTNLYRVENDQHAPFMKTYYPEAHGGRAELARSIPFVGNSALIFMNVPGMAHGATIPRDAEQSTRYAYQFYVGPRKSKLARLVQRLPPELAASWADLKALTDE
jgi:hypothetical protein